MTLDLPPDHWWICRAMGDIRRMFEAERT